MAGRGRKGGGKSRATIHMSKPEPPPFLQRIREQIVANEDTDRIERSEKKRKDRPARVEDSEDDPTVVKVNDDDLTEEEYNRMKLELETQYKLSDDRGDKKPKLDNKELDVDTLIKIRNSNKSRTSSSRGNTPRKGGDSGVSGSKSIPKITSKTLNYGSSSEEEQDEEEEEKEG